MTPFEELEKQLTENYNFGYEDLEFILNTEENPIFSKYLGSINVRETERWAGKFPQGEYYPRLFGDKSSAEFFFYHEGYKTYHNLTGKEKASIHTSGHAFHQIIIEEI